MHIQIGIICILPTYFNLGNYQLYPFSINSLKLISEINETNQRIWHNCCFCTYVVVNK